MAQTYKASYLNANREEKIRITAVMHRKQWN